MSFRFERRHDGRSRVILWIDHQGFELGYDCSPEDGINMTAKMEWIENQVRIALNRLATQAIDNYIEATKNPSPDATEISHITTLNRLQDLGFTNAAEREMNSIPAMTMAIWRMAERIVVLEERIITIEKKGVDQR